MNHVLSTDMSPREALFLTFILQKTVKQIMIFFSTWFYIMSCNGEVDCTCNASFPIEDNVFFSPFVDYGLFSVVFVSTALGAKSS